MSAIQIANEFTGVLTGKGLAFGGSEIRVEATGYGCVYMIQDMLKHRREPFEGQTCMVSGSGNVAQYTVEKLIELGAKPVTVSDSWASCSTRRVLTARSSPGCMIWRRTGVAGSRSMPRSSAPSTTWANDPGPSGIMA